MFRVVSWSQRRGGRGKLFLGIDPVCEWEPNLEASIAWLRTHLNAATVLSDDCLYRGQPEPRSFPDALRREKRIKDMRPYLWRNSRTAVADLDHNILIPTEGSNPKRTLAEHGFNGVLDNVCPDLVQFSSHRVNQKRERLVSAEDA